MLKQALLFARLHAVHVWVVGMLLATVACAVVLSTDLPAASLAATLHDEGNVTAHLRMLKGGGGGDDDGGGSDEPVALYDEGGKALLWIVLGSAQAALLSHFAVTAFMPFEQLHILMISIVVILRKVAMGLELVT